MELLRGLQLLVSNPRLWPLCIKPMLWALTGYVGLGALAWWLIVPRVAGWMGSLGVGGGLTEAALSLALGLLWLWLFPVLFVGISGAFAGFFWDRLSLEVERLDGAEPPTVSLPLRAVVIDSLVRLVVALVVTVIALIGALFTGPVAPALAAGLLGLLDYTSPAGLRRGWLFGEQKKRVLKPAGLGFGLAVGIASMIPILNLFLWPAAVAGGTLLVRRLEATGPVPR
jgi:CysZ protein